MNSEPMGILTALQIFILMCVSVHTLCVPLITYVQVDSHGQNLDPIPVDLPSKPIMVYPSLRDFHHLSGCIISTRSDQHFTAKKRRVS